MLGLRSNTDPLWLLPHRVRRTWNFPRCANQSKLQPPYTMAHANPSLRLARFGKEVNIWRGGGTRIKLIVTRRRYMCPGLLSIVPFARSWLERRKSFYFSPPPLPPLLSFITSSLFPKWTVDSSSFDWRCFQEMYRVVWAEHRIVKSLSRELYIGKRPSNAWILCHVDDISFYEYFA